MATYRGQKQRDARGGMIVTKDGEEFSPTRSQHLVNHSPDGFNWGYGGSGPAQLALALLLDTCGNEEIALAWYQQYKWDVVAALGDSWELSQESIRDWLKLQGVEL